MSHHAVHVSQPVLGIDLARAAGATAERLGLDLLMAEAAAMEAHGLARLGDERACADAMARAEQALGRADRDTAPDWLGWFGEAYLAAKFAHCLRDVGRPAEAEPYARRSLDMDGRYLRGRMFNTALLATVHAEKGEVEEACALGIQAVDMAAQMSSRRAVEYLGDLRARLRRYGDAAEVRVFEERARTGTVGRA